MQCRHRPGPAEPHAAFRGSAVPWGPGPVSGSLHGAGLSGALRRLPCISHYRHCGPHSPRPPPPSPRPPQSHPGLLRAAISPSLHDSFAQGCRCSSELPFLLRHTNPGFGVFAPLCPLTQGQPQPLGPCRTADEGL